MELVLDTSIVIDIERKQLKNEVEELLQGKNISIAALTLSELWFGILNLNKGKQETFQERIKKYHLINTSEKSSKLAAEIKQKLIKTGELIPGFDILIASIVMANDSILVTKDEHFKKIKGLELISV